MQPMSDQDVDAVFKALASSHRRDVLSMLGDAEARSDGPCCASIEVCACKVSERLGLSASTTSHHMGVLTAAGLVSARKDGLWTYYALRRDTLDLVAEALRGY